MSTRHAPQLSPADAARMLALCDYAMARETRDPLAYLRGWLARASCDAPRCEPQTAGHAVARVEVTRRGRGDDR